jgi:lipopolysaccharide export system protein LptA
MTPLILPPEPPVQIQIFPTETSRVITHLKKPPKSKGIDPSKVEHAWTLTNYSYQFPKSFFDKKQNLDLLASTTKEDLPKSQLKQSYGSKTYLITQDRNGDRRRFELSIPAEESEDNPQSPQQIETPATIETVKVVEVIADRQEYNEQEQVITAKGNVVMRFAQAVLTGDSLQVNLVNRIAVAQGNVVLKRGEQVLRGEKFEYYLVQDRGTVTNASGEVYQPTLQRDFSTQLREDATIPDRALSDRLTASQPVTDVTSDRGVGVVFGSTRDLDILDTGRNSANNNSGGTINRLRFQAEKVNFETNTWQASNFRLTNDPFSPPELEIRAETANFQQTAPLVNELTTTKSRLVIDQSFSVPLLANRLVFDRRPRQPQIIKFGFDGEERGGLFIERSFELVDTEKINWEITPQYFFQRAVFPDAFGFNDGEEGGVFNSSVFGVKSKFDSLFSPRTSLQASTTLTSLDFNDIEDNLRAKVAFNQKLGELSRPYDLSLEYNFRERLFNGSLGFQTVYSSIGAVVTSPVINLEKIGVNLNFQGSVQNISADTDRPEFVDSGEEEERINLTRYQGAVSLNKGFLIWQGKGLPPTQDGGLRYTPMPVVPYLQLNTGVTGVSSFYSNGDTQQSLRLSVGLQGQLGNFSRSYLDYTGFNFTYFQGIRGDESPFLFDRFVDQQALSLGITQQLYGPIRLGVQTSFNLNDGDEISTDYVLEYSRRTHNVTLRYNPILEIGSISFRINDFNWRGDPEPFDSTGVRPVVQGVSR